MTTSTPILDAFNAALAQFYSTPAGQLAGRVRWTGTPEQVQALRGELMNTPGAVFMLDTAFVADDGPDLQYRGVAIYAHPDGGGFSIGEAAPSHSRLKLYHAQAVAETLWHTLRRISELEHDMLEHDDEAALASYTAKVRELAKRRTMLIGDLPADESVSDGAWVASETETLRGDLEALEAWRKGARALLDSGLLRSSKPAAIACADPAVLAHSVSPVLISFDVSSEVRELAAGLRELCTAASELSAVLPSANDVDAEVRSTITHLLQTARAPMATFSEAATAAHAAAQLLAVVK